MKIHPVGDEMFHVDGQINTWRSLVAFVVLRMRQNAWALVALMKFG